MTIIGGQLDVYDNGNGSVTLAWPQLASAVDSYNVYVNGVRNQNVATRKATVTGLQAASYSSSTQVKTPALTYTFKVVAVSGGVEVAASLDRSITVQPTSVVLTTPMRRPFPFPNTAPGG